MSKFDAAIEWLKEALGWEPDGDDGIIAAIRVLEAAAKLTEPGMLSLHRVICLCNIHDGCSYCKEMDGRLAALLHALPDDTDAKEKP